MSQSFSLLNELSQRINEMHEGRLVMETNLKAYSLDLTNTITEIESPRSIPVPVSSSL
jgi:hypothetical protein